MNRDILVNVNTINDYTCVEDKDVSDISVSGQYFERNGKIYILYENDGASTRIKADGCCVEITRSVEGVSNTLVYQENMVWATEYNTGYGRMMMQIKTKSLKQEITDDKLFIRIDYDVLMNEQLMSHNKVTIQAESV